MKKLKNQVSNEIFRQMSLTLTLPLDVPVCPMDAKGLIKHGSMACSPTDKANLFGSYFSANSSLSDSNAPDPPTQPLSNPIPSIIISARKVRRVLRSLKTDKASGPDGIPPRFLKEFADELAPVLCRLFRLILISCTYPSSWKHALIQPVPKKGDRSNPSNYRPIALTSAVAKVFETLLNSHFIKHGVLR